MLWEVELRPLGRDGERERVCDEFDLLTHGERGGDLVSGSARGFVLSGELDEATVKPLRRFFCERDETSGQAPKRY